MLTYIEADPARLQPLRPPRQHVQGAHQDPREGADAGGVRAPGRGRVGRDLKDGPATLTEEEIARVAAYFAPPAYEKLPDDDRRITRSARRQPRVRATGSSATCMPHKVPGYASVTLSLKKTGVPPGDATAEQMDCVADLADEYSFGELRVSHEQNLILADVKKTRPASRCGRRAEGARASRRRTSAC